MSRRRTLWLILAIVFLVVVFYLWGSSKTPPGQPTLMSLKPSNAADFQQAFNAAAADTRIVLLLSPT